MKTKKLISLVMVIALVITCLAACGGTTTGGETQAAATKATEAAATEATEAAEVVTAEAVDPGTTSAKRETINVGIEADVTNWDPWASGSSGRNDCLCNVYQNLIDYDPLVGQFNCVLAKSWTKSDDNMSYDVELWDNIVDSEGNEITAEDVEHSLACAAEIATDLKDIVMEIKDDYNFTFTFVDDDGKTQRKIEVGEEKRFCFYIVDSKYDAAALAAKPIGTGAYKFEAQESGYSITLVANENYWQTDDQREHIRDRQNVEKITFYVIPESAQRTTALQNGTIDLCAYISADDLDKFEGNGFWIYEYPHNLSMEMWCNCDETSPCNDLNLRLAVNYAVDANVVLASVYNGKGKVLYDQCPDWQIGYNSDWESQDNYYTNPSLDTAKEYLDKSKYAGETLKIICNTTSACVNTAQIVLSLLGQIGVNAEICSYESSVYSEYIQDPANWDIMVNTRPASAGYLANGWESDMASYRQPWGGTINFVFDDDFQEMLATVLKMDTSTEENFNKLHDYMIENAYSKGLVNYNVSVVVPDYITDVALSYRKTVVPGGCTYTAE